MLALHFLAESARTHRVTPSGAKNRNGAAPCKIVPHRPPALGQAGAGSLRFRGGPLVLVGVLAEVVRTQVLDVATAESAGRAFGALDLALAAAVAWLNRPGDRWRHGSRCVQLAALGVAANAVPVLVTGSVPFWGHGARLAGVPAADVASLPVRSSASATSSCSSGSPGSSPWCSPTSASAATTVAAIYAFAAPFTSSH